MQRPVIFKSDEYELSGMLHLPYKMSTERPVPAVIFCHGFIGNKIEAHRIFVKMARLFERHRIASLRFDFRGCGDSSGDFHTTTVMGEVTDARNAVNFIAGQPGVDANRIGVIGLSLGGAVAAYTAGRDKRVKVLGLWAPAADLDDELEQYQNESEVTKIIRLNAIDYYGTLIGKQFITEIPKVKPLPVLKNFRGSAIILHGAHDDSVPLSHSLKYYNVLKKNRGKVERILVSDSDHVFSSYAWEQEVLKRTLKFFVNNL